VQHSLSPTMHRAAYRRLGLSWTYEAIEVVPEGLPAFLDDLDESWRGLSLTMPLKRTVVPLLDGLDEHARRSRAANTLLLTGERRLGFNTDVPGAATAMAAHLHGPVDSAVVLGGGATATSVLLALADRRCAEARIVVRDPARAAETVATVSEHPTPPDLEVLTFEELGSVDCDLVVSTIPPAAQTPQVLAAVAAVPAVFDVVYDPWPTPLAQAALDSQRLFISGIELLGYQAELQVQIMTGRPVAAGVLIAAAAEELERRVVENGPREAPGP
jgi:shikimate dehydrogenase